MCEFKIGDDVKLLDKEKSTYGKIGTVIDIDPILSGLYAVRCLDDESVGLYYESELKSCEEELEYDWCYECTGYGDDYSYDPEKDDLVCNCSTCPHNERRSE